MTQLFLLRHFPTQWNAQRRIQGKTDIGLAESAKQTLASMTIAAPWLKLQWYSSPLQRARQTAALLGAKNVEVADPLREMDWGQFEGLTLKEIEREIVRRELSPDSGLDLQAPGGESPRMVCQRLAKWIAERPANDPDSIAVTHKGVIRAALSLGTGWDMSAPYPGQIDWALPLLFDISAEGQLKLIQINCDWQDSSLLNPDNSSC